MVDDIPNLLLRYSKFNRSHKSLPMDTLKSLLEVSSLKIEPSQNYLPRMHIFDDLSEASKRLCDAQVSLCEETMDEQAIAIQFSGSEEEKNKKNNDLMIGKLRLLRLKREYMRLLMPGQVPFKVLLLIVDKRNQ
jgi:hypothetical protein